MPRINAVEEIVDLLSDLGARILLKEMTAGNQLGTAPHKPEK